MVTALARGRAAHINVGSKEARVISVTVPKNISVKELNHVNERIYEVIKGLTRHPCYSGLIDVIFDHRFEQTLDVNLGHDGGREFVVGTAEQDLGRAA